MEALRQFAQGLGVGVTDLHAVSDRDQGGLHLGNAHLHEHLSCILLQATNVDSTLGDVNTNQSSNDTSSDASRLQPPTQRSLVGQTIPKVVISAHTERGHDTASEAQWVITEDRFGSTVVILFIELGHMLLVDDPTLVEMLLMNALMSS